MRTDSTKSPLLVGIFGPTASGKSQLAETLAGRLDAVVLNADAFQVYKGLDIGTNKPANRKQYRLLDLVDPTANFGVGEWIRHACKLLQDEFSAGRHVIVCGGTGLYMRALFEEYREMHGQPDDKLRRQLMEDEQELGLEHVVNRLRELDSGLAGTIDLKNGVRVRRALERILSINELVTVNLPPFEKLKIGLSVDRNALWQVIENRTQTMFEQGWVAEVEKLKAAGVPENAPGFRAIGYQSILSFLGGGNSLLQAHENIVTQTRQYAKRQISWMRTEPMLQSIQGDVKSPENDSALVEVWKLIQPRLG